MRHKLITKAIEKATPALGHTDGMPKDQIRIRAKFFTPWSSYTWYMTEYDPELRMGYGWIHNAANQQGGELGYFSIEELESLKGPFGCQGVEREMYGKQPMLSEVIPNTAWYPTKPTGVTQ